VTSGSSSSGSKDIEVIASEGAMQRANAPDEAPGGEQRGEKKGDGRDRRRGEDACGED
jgi:hypothetical protein